MCNTAKDIWKTLLITHQGNNQVIDSAFARFNTIITSLKALDEGYSSKNYVRKFLRALHPKWRAKVTAIEESKDLTSLSLVMKSVRLLEVKTKSTPWHDEEDDEKVKNETCLVAQASSEICLRVDLEPNKWIKDSGCSKHMTGNQNPFSSYKAYNR
ncbi:hypothetical protein Tco_0037385, partial [Tanacetum coccineum]